MTTKESIQVGERLLDSYKVMMGRLNDAQTTDEVLACLRDIEKEKLNERIVNIEAKLAPLRKQHLVEFEKQSAEANMKIGAIVEEAEQWFGKEPLAITEKIRQQCYIYKAAETLTQEGRNHIYSELVGHLNFLKTKIKQ